MQYAGHLPNLPATGTMLVSVIALVVGALVATGAHVLIDDTDGGTQNTRYIVVQQPAQGSADIPGKNEATTAAAISPQTDAVSPAEALRSDPHGPAISLRNP